MIQVQAGDQVYITQVAWLNRADIEKHCRRVTVAHQTPKSVLIKDGTAQRWIPKTALARSRHDDIFLLREWFVVPARWRRVFGHPK